jgi:hypothetical protein
LLRFGRLLTFAAIVLLAGISGDATADKPAPNGAAKSLFFSVDHAKDCVFDAQRQRLYVTNEKQLVVIDVKDKKTIKTLDLPGKLRPCDMTPDGKHLAVGPQSGMFFYWVSLDDLDVTQVRLKPDGRELGVFDLCTGADGSVLLSMAVEDGGSASQKLRRYDPQTNATTEVGVSPRYTALAASGDRRYAAVAEGDISNGPLKLYDFQEKTLRTVAALGDFNYEIACSTGARYFAWPHREDCALLDEKGGRVSNLPGKPVIAAAFNPKADRLFVMRDGDTSIQEYSVPDQKPVNQYPLDKALAIAGKVSERVVANVTQTSKKSAVGTIRRVRTVSYKKFDSGRMRVTDDGQTLCVVVPTGVYLFATKKTLAEKEEGTKFKVIDSK